MLYTITEAGAKRTYIERSVAVDGEAQTMKTTNLHARFVCRLYRIYKANRTFRLHDRSVESRTEVGLNSYPMLQLTGSSAQLLFSCFF